MEKIFDLLDTAIAVLLVVIALSAQLYENYRLTELLNAKKVAAEVNPDACLRDRCDGLELAARLGVLAEKKEEIISFAGREYSWPEFGAQVLGITVLPETNAFLADRRRQEELRQRRFQVYQFDGKWRIEE